MARTLHRKEEKKGGLTSKKLGWKWCYFMGIQWWDGDFWPTNYLVSWLTWLEKPNQQRFLDGSIGIFNINSNIISIQNIIFRIFHGINLEKIIDINAKNDGDSVGEYGEYHGELLGLESPTDDELLGFLYLPCLTKQGKARCGALRTGIWLYSNSYFHFNEKKYGHRK